MGYRDQCRKRAIECIDAADHATCPERKVTLLELAQRWLMLANQVDENGPDSAFGEMMSGQRVH